MATVKILLIGGGGGGGDMGGGGGGGVVYNASYTVSTQNYSVGVGNGGAKFYQQPYGFNLRGYNGENTTFAGLLAYGGGGGGSFSDSGGAGVGADGGSGGGGAIQSGNFGLTGGNSINSQGYAGGGGSYQGTYHLALGGGGGGGGGVGGAGYGANDGGIGYQSDISGTLTYYAGGGKGLNGSASGQGTLGKGGDNSQDGNSGVVIIAYRRGGLDGVSESSYLEVPAGGGTGSSEFTTATHKVHIMAGNAIFHCVLSINETFSVSVGAFTLTGVDALITKAKARLLALVAQFNLTGVAQNITAFVRRKNQSKHSSTFKNQDKS